MRVVIASSSVPHVNGGGNLIVQWTAQALREAGHEVEEFYLPFPVGVRALLPAMVGMRATPFAGSGDRLITIRWPAHLIRHENKTTWFIHHYRQLFDLWDTPYRGVPRNAEGVAYREAVRRIDNIGLRECTSVFTNSAIVGRRLQEYNGVDSVPLLPPLGGDTARFRTEGYGDFIFYPSRVTSIKRQLLAIEALEHTRTPVRLVIAGKADSPGYEELLVDRVRELDLTDRVELRLGWMEETEKTDLLAQCLAVTYLPLDEDSYGYPSLEASHSAKAIVTVTDAGGALEFVVDGTHGFVTAPEPKDLARAFDQLYEDRALAERMGTACFDRRAELDISWEHVLPRLLEDS